jgi:hemolysin activation/secretion protein
MYEIPESGSFTQSVQAGVDYKDFSNNTVFAGQNNITPVTYFPFTAGYSATLSGKARFDSIDLSLNFASPRLGSNTHLIQQNRSNALGQDLYLRVAYDHTQDLPAGFSLHGHIGGQVAEQPLINNEQFFLGGAHAVRGYFEGEDLVDTGYAGRLELISPSLPQLAHGLHISSDLAEMHVVSFGDFGGGLLLDPLQGENSHFRLASVGLGAQANILRHVDGELDWSTPLLTGPYTRAGDQQILFRVTTEY